MTMKPYKLRSSLSGHEKDVRCIDCIRIKNYILSGSRDRTCKLWLPQKDSNEFVQSQEFGGHKGFVSSLCYSDSWPDFPSGLIFTGSNDSTINAYTIESPNPVFSLVGHENNVCTLQCTSSGYIFSGSWDKSAKLWKNKKCLHTLKGHEAAVWSVLIMETSQVLLTASADCTIRIWNMEGHLVKNLKAHGDCVRGLAKLTDLEFLSCSNDGTINLWDTSGNQIKTFHGHSNFVYAVVGLPDGKGFASCGEDRTLRIWSRDSNDCLQTITHPAQSVWCVAVLSNGDLVTGASDSMIRVFSTDPCLQAPPDILKAFEDDVAASNIPSQIGDIETSKLPGPEALDKPGTKEGQVMMVKEEKSIVCYQWSANESRWIKVGDVVGSNSSGTAESTKVLYEGKEYDYVFSVDIEEGKPPLKLPYNRSEDPWLAAQNFLHKNNLSQLFLDQVANFIVQQSGGNINTLGTGSSAAYSDPFTGGGRYVPGSEQKGGSSGAYSDPFTGAGRYVPASTDRNRLNGAASDVKHTTGDDPSGALANYFPTKDFVCFDAINLKSLVDKLKQFAADSSSTALDDSTLKSIENISLLDNNQKVDLLKSVLSVVVKWPLEKIFPLLDVIRYLVKDEACNTALFESNNDVIKIVELGCSPDKPVANRMLLFRIMTNAFLGLKGLQLMRSSIRDYLRLIAAVKVNETKGLQIAAASFILNASIMSVYQLRDSELQIECCDHATDMLFSALDAEANFRILVALGTLATDGDPRLLTKLSANTALRNAVDKTASSDGAPVKLMETAVLLLSLL